MTARGKSEIITPQKNPSFLLFFVFCHTPGSEPGVFFCVKIAKKCKKSKIKLAERVKIGYKSPVNQQTTHNMMHKLTRNKEAVHATAKADCKKLGLACYVVKRDCILAADSKKELRKFRQVIYSALEYDKNNPETWCTELIPVINKKLRKQEYIWDDKLHAKHEGLPIPE